MALRAHTPFSISPRLARGHDPERWSRADRLSHVPAVTEWVFLWGRWKEGGFFVLSASGRSIEVVKNIGSVGCEGGEWRVCSTVISPGAEISEQYLTGL